MHLTHQEFDTLLHTLQLLPSLLAIGKAGGETLPEDGFSDIDLFLFCKQIPAPEVRELNYALLPRSIRVVEFGSVEHPHWGLVDSILIGEQEVYLMYFTRSTFDESIDAILLGERTEREKNYFYPTGRLASIQGMYTFYDLDGYLTNMKSRVSTYPDALRDAILSRSLAKIDDEEDFMRAISRNDVLFYHSTLDLALDRFLQTLFALNRTYFPSRKRSLEFIRGFAIKPEDCEARLEQVVALGACPDTLEESYQVWQSLCYELKSSASLFAF